MGRPLVDLFGAPSPFDPQHTLVTSPFFSSAVLACIRFSVAVYTLVTLVFLIIWDSVKDQSGGQFFSYFTNLTFTGICAYYWASFVQTAFYTRRRCQGKDGYPLQSWAKTLQVLHLMLQTTIVTFPILVTVVFWVLLASPETLGNTLNQYRNITVHALNTVFCGFEMIFTNNPPPKLLMLPFMILILIGYLGVAYITHETQGFYPYSFLDPQKQGPLLAAYIAGIGVAEVLLFGIAWVAMWARQKFFSRSLEQMEETESTNEMTERELDKSKV
ncbi:hypothetical protein WG66_002437 [Moniliophthora roreri]|uniref:FAR-17a/AIG1-like protein n=1 Tax=Moniliophthora roreri TaxID=221103 RepID=A0A0W0F818_MONRR|nr:hypothetical protein WG66_002437 [Moniliophthora roreri]